MGVAKLIWACAVPATPKVRHIPIKKTPSQRPRPKPVFDTTRSVKLIVDIAELSLKLERFLSATALSACAKISALDFQFTHYLRARKCAKKAQ
jgi:hypothetical protein